MMKGSSSREKKVILTVMIAALCFVGSAAQATTVTLTLDYQPGGTFDLYAAVSTGDNFGLAYYNVPLVDITAATHNSPMGTDPDNNYFAGGFTGGGVNPTIVGGEGTLFAYQDTGGANAPSTLLYGVGQTAGTINTVGTPRGIPWASPVKIGFGTWNTAGSAPAFGEVNDTTINLFAIHWTTGSLPEGVISAAGTVNTVVIPEPATLAVLSIGVGLMVMLRRRRLS